MKIAIVTDSTCDLPPEAVASHGITVIPIYVNVDGESYQDGVELSRQEFYRRLPHMQSPPTTSVPGPQAFLAAYEKLADAGYAAILSIHISEQLSAMVNVARQAAQQFARSGIPVQVLDSGQLSVGTGVQVLAAARALRDGASLAEVQGRLAQLKPRIHVFAALDTLEYLRRSGRLARYQELMGNLLRVKPILTMNDDAITMERVRTGARAMTWLIDYLRALLPVEEITVVHSNAQERAEALWERAQPLLSGLPRPSFVNITPVLGAHIGPGVVGFTCVQAAPAHKHLVPLLQSSTIEAESKERGEA